MMQAYRVEKVISSDGRIQLDALPFKAGEVVEIIVLPGVAPGKRTTHRKLKGSVLEYKDPTDPVALDDWDALK